jgi:hypothetical protein
MATRKERECLGCGKISTTFSKAEYCIPCAKAKKLEEINEQHKVLIASWGYKILSEPKKDKDGHICFELITPCGHRYTTKFVNLNRLVETAKAKGLPMPCGTCGPKHRMNTALSSYVEKHGRDYDIQKWDDYRLLVRKLSDITYRQFKEEINPLNYRRGKKTWHLDHIFPIIECFKQGWPAEKAASRENLQMLHWQENLMKSGKI